jgi:hypothetical protein
MRIMGYRLTVRAFGVLLIVASTYFESSTRIQPKDSRRPVLGGPPSVEKSSNVGG